MENSGKIISLCSGKTRNVPSLPEYLAIGKGNMSLLVHFRDETVVLTGIGFWEEIVGNVVTLSGLARLALFPINALELHGGFFIYPDDSPLNALQ